MYVKDAEQMLTQKLIPFWQGMRDNENGGFTGWMDFDQKKNLKAEKGCILHSRILWFFSTASMVLHRADLLDDATHAYKFLKQYCVDKQNGGIYWSVNYDGSVLDSTKHTYNQAFAIYAFSAYYRASGDKEALAAAKALYNLIEHNCTDTVGYLEAFDRQFRPVSNEKLSDNKTLLAQGKVAEKTMNTLLHVFEGYSGLYEAAHDPQVGQSMRHILQIFLNSVYNPLKRRQEVFFDKNLNSLIDMQSYGHDIETSWLLDWGCGLLHDNALDQQVQDADSALAAEVYRSAYHKHSVWNECVLGQVDKTRVWWVQAESVVGFLNAYQKHPEHKEYLQAAANIWQYINDHLVDPRAGSEWFWQVDDDGQPDRSKPIVEPWKCPYHNGRMCFEIIRRGIDAPC
ncbi:MAG: AGE family epimerase/isomerase [Oscillospiraceae bacterium]|jgi:mannobiose 2-epimerase|nr:AGE family epimerase/isomerase [Oscillospiraceae bacterium]MDD3260644.1 AGE family epimerase/isomerase [Oscillospiraceae bacterium]